MTVNRMGALAILLFRLILPGALLLGISIRPFGISILYLLLYLIFPLVRCPDGRTVKGLSGKVVVLTLAVSALILIAHGVFHIVLAATPPYGQIVSSDQDLATVLLYFGFVPFVNISPEKAVEWLSPDIIVFLVSLVVLITLRKILSPLEETNDHLPHKEYQRYPLLTKVCAHTSVIIIMITSALQPNAVSAVYFFTFITVSFVWALGKPLSIWYAKICRLLMFLMAVHVLIIFIYQNNFITEIIPPTSLIARLIGLRKLVIIESNVFYHGVESWQTYANPLMILFCYYVLALVSKEIFKPKHKSKLSRHMNGSLRSRKFSKRFHRARSKSRERWIDATHKAKVATVSDRVERPVAPKETTPLLRTPRPSASNIQSKRKSLERVEKKTSEAIEPSNAASNDAIELAAAESTVKNDAETGEGVPEGSELLPDPPGGSEKALSASKTKSGSEDEELEEDDPYEEPTFCDELILAVYDFFRVLIRSSYIATSIAMMAWSIMYHSWVTFVLLMWANIVWLHPNQRKAMLRWSPLLVIYATMLLFAQYILSLDLNDDELPTIHEDDAPTFKAIGLARPDNDASRCFPIIIKSAFCLMFFNTLRQRVQEGRSSKTVTNIADLAAPMHLPIRAAAPGQRDEDPMESRLLAQAGKWLRSVCIKFWIYMVAITLFVIGITGERMTVFRIVYMFMFLAFTLMFQISVRIWRKMLYPFWIALIIYSMANLVVIYVYQFESFHLLIEKHLKIPFQLQKDLGLERFTPADLFVKLLTPTLFLIITIIQLHYFHKDFMEISKLKSRQSSIKMADITQLRSQSGVSTIKDDVANLSLDSEAAEELKSQVYSVQVSNKPSSSVVRKTSFRDFHSTAPTVTEHTSETFKSHVNGLLAKGKRIFDNWTDLVFLYMEMNMTKLVFLSFMFLCVFNVAAIHVPIMILICPALLFTSKKQRCCLLFCTILVASYLMANMVYQIQHIDEAKFIHNCVETLKNGTMVNVTYNNAEWVGFKKATKEKSLPSLVAGYIGIIAITTLNSVVMYRQSRLRSFNNYQLKNKEQVMFPEVTRKDADKNLKTCIKYLFNYGFYKFGIEVTLIWLVGVIGSRMDALALAYGGWLCILAVLSRSKLRSVWPLFTGYVTTILPLQYLLSVGLVPLLCVVFPWTDPVGDDTYSAYRDYFFLPDPHQRPHATKLIFDYFLLLFCARQGRVFSKEKKFGAHYPGGYNGTDVGQHYETPQWVNPVPDFLNYIGATSVTPLNQLLCGLRFYATGSQLITCGDMIGVHESTGCRIVHRVTHAIACLYNHSWLDIVKRGLLQSMLWITLAVMFLTGTNRVNLFSIGYLLGSFVFLWQGTDFYLRPKKSILKW